MKVILFGALFCLVVGAQAGLLTDILSKLTKDEQAFAERLHKIFELIAKGNKKNTEELPEPTTRGLMKKFNHHCDCLKNNCGCCGKVDAMGTKMDACVNVSVIANEYALQVKGKLGFLNLIDEKVSIKKLERACKRVPIFSKIKVCIHSKMEELEKSGDFKSCMAVEIDAYGSTIAYVNFKCLKYVDGELTATDEMMEVDPSKDPAIAVDSPNPINAIVDAIKNAKNNADNDVE